MDGQKQHDLHVLMRTRQLSSMRHWRTEILWSMTAILLCAFSAEAVTADPVAIIVNLENTTEGVSSSELVKIFKQEKQHWPGGKQIYLVMREAGSPERAIVVKKVYRMRNDFELKKLWIMKQFRGTLFSFPKVLKSNEAVTTFVHHAPSAIGYIDAASVDDRVRVLPIDGKLPGEAGYLLSSAP